MSTALETLEICFAANLGGVDAQLNGLAAQLGALSHSMDGLDRVFMTAGVSMIDGLRSGLNEAMSGLQARMDAMGAELRGGLTRAVNAVDASKCGRALADGFASGIRSGSNTVGAAISSIVNTALGKMRSMLEIHSPSKVAERLGVNFGVGFAQGLDDSMATVEQASASLSNAAMGISPGDIGAEDNFSQTLQSALERALGGTQIVVPLNVDGMKLGEASIRGINAVTKSAGRLLLEI